MPADLSKEAIAHREKLRLQGGREGGFTGRELITVAGKIFAEAKRQARVAGQRSGKRAQRARAQADQALMTAAAQIRLAQICHLDRPYMHTISLEQIQQAKAEAEHAYQADPAALAVDTHRRIQAQRQRIQQGAS